MTENILFLYVVPANNNDIKELTTKWNLGYSIPIIILYLLKN